MNTQEEKISLLLEMIAFSVVDGRLHQREYDFLILIATELKISKADFDDLFHQELPTFTMKSEFERIKQFYRLALLMHSDGIMHEREKKAIHEIGINMGLNPFAMKRILKAMEVAPSNIISADFLLSVFQEQNN